MKSFRKPFTWGLTAAVVVLFALHPAQAGEFAKVGTVGTQFLKIPIGARGVAMGHAFSALSNDATAMFWNPAGLTSIEGSTVLLEHVNWLADMSFDAVGAARKLNNAWAVGVFAATLNSGDIERTTVEFQSGTGTYYAVTDMMAGVTVAAMLTDRFSFGANLKYVREDLDGEIASAYAVDVGTNYDTRWHTIKLSMSIRNFGPEIQLAGTYVDYDRGQPYAEKEFLPYQFPMIFKLGFSAEPIKTATQTLTLVGELEHPNDNLERYNIGAEFGFQQLFFLRGGYVFRHDTLGLSAGIGAMWNGFGIDYAFSDFSVLDQVHRFNVHFTF